MIYKFPKTYGPFKCEGFGCTAKTQICRVIDRHEVEMVEKYGGSIILTKRLGKMFCPTCLTIGPVTKNNKKLIALIAGNMEEARHFLTKTICPVFSMKDIVGRRFGKIILFGNYHQNPMLEQVWLTRMHITDYAVNSLKEKAKIFHEDLSNFTSSTVAQLVDEGHIDVERYSFTI